MIRKLEEYGQVLANVDLKKYNTYGIGGKSAYLVKPFTPKSFLDLLKYLKSTEVPFYLLGGGSNVILPDADFSGVIIKLDNLNKITFKEDLVEVEAGVYLNTLVNKTLNQGFTNLTFLYGIPGTIGGAINGNVGSFSHEIFDYLVSITIINENDNIVTLKKEDISYGYRYTEFKKRNVYIISAVLKLEKEDVEEAKLTMQKNWQYRITHQPIGTKNAGSVFANPSGLSAGKLIEDANLKGCKIGGAIVSKVHANFIINSQNAQSSDIINLIKLIKKEVYTKFKVELELEQIIVKWGNNNGKKDQEEIII